MCGKTFFWIFYIVVTVLKVLSLHPCDSSGYRDVEENTTVTFYCDQYKSKTATWRFKGPNSNTFNIISQCSPSSCEMSSTPPFSVTYISDGNSSLTSKLTSRGRDQAGGEYECDGRTCKVHIIVPAVVSNITSFISRTGKGYSVSCEINITQIYSSRGHYSCVWQVGTTENLNGTLNLHPTPTRNTSNTSDRTGSCKVTASLPQETGVYMCSVTLYPGETNQSSDSFEIAAADEPEQQNEIDIPALAGGVAGGIVIVIVVVIIVCVRTRQQKGVKKSPSNHRQVRGRRASEREMPDNGSMHVNSCYESSELPFGQVSEDSYEYIENRLSMNPTLQVAAYAHSSKYAEEENTSDEYAHIRRDR